MTPRRITTQVADISGFISPLPSGPLWPTAAEVWAYVGDEPEKVVTLTFRVMDGQPVLTGVGIRQVVPDWPRPAEVTEDDIRALLPLQELVDEAVRAVTVVVGAAGTEPPDARRRGPLTREFLEWVAYVVRSNPRTPMRSLAESYFHTSERTAWRWVTAAREKGLLPDTPTSEGRRQTEKGLKK